MNETLNWDYLRLFLAVARHGGLAGAVAETKLSAPTLGRRMLTLERSLGLTLFVRNRDGYSLTLQGKNLFARVEALETHALKIVRWQLAIDPPNVVQVAAGFWTSIFIARNLEHLLCDGRRIHLEIVSGSNSVDIARREASLGIRNQPPKVQGLAGRKLFRVSFAVYGSDLYVNHHPQAFKNDRFKSCDWIEFTSPGLKVASSGWLGNRLSKSPYFVCSSAQVSLEAVVADMGLGIFPCFIGDAESKLVRVSNPIKDLEHTQWLVSHDDDRSLPPVRAVSNWLFKIFKENKSLLCGKLTG